MKQIPVVLIADDDQDMINQLKVVLKPILNQIELWVASNGLETVQLCQQYTPNLLLLDHGMPGIDGFTACQMIRNMNPDCSMDIWFITGLVAEDDLSLAMEAGADCLIHKPINIMQLRKKIIEHLKLFKSSSNDSHSLNLSDYNDPAA